MERLLLRPDEAAEVLGIGRSKIYALLADGQLPSVRVGHSLRVPASALERWVEERSVGGPQPVGCPEPRPSEKSVT